MEHSLLINWMVGVNSQGDAFRSLFHTGAAEIDLPPCPQLSPRASIDGKLLSISPQLFGALKFNQDVQVMFDARVYNFSRLEKDGNFQLLKTW